MCRAPLQGDTAMKRYYPNVEVETCTAGEAQ